MLISNGSGPRSHGYMLEGGLPWNRRSFINSKGEEFKKDVSSLSAGGGARRVP